MTFHVGSFLIGVGSVLLPLTAAKVGSTFFRKYVAFHENKSIVHHQTRSGRINAAIESQGTALPYLQYSNQEVGIAGKALKLKSLLTP